ncbi:hypothetical protein [Flavobacterium lacustre]|uniref:hypothetical protein n=1 Tax=Flavobacterium lacustre TaxID=3016339 RepID=UPI0022B6FB3C|nr:hypothetical protein [Flavobacterium lacustre]
MDIEEDQKVFEDKIKEIFFYSSRYGVYTMFKGKTPSVEFDPKELNRLCFEGFKIAQIKIIEELKLLQVKSKNYFEEIKQAKRERNKEAENNLTKQTTILDYQSDIYRNLADTIAWQMLNGQHYLYRRLYTYETGNKDLLDKSFEFVIQFADEINSNPDAFCLICDITNNIQLGDCLITDKDGIKISEIKSGETNFKALDVIKEKELKEENFKEEELVEEFDEKFIKQLKRMLNQNAKTERASKIIKDNKGKDPKYNDTTVHIVENDFEIETYLSIITNLIKKLDEKDWAYDCIEGIVHLGVYKNDWRMHGQFTMKSLCKAFPFYDLMTGRGVTICEPIFLKPIIDENIIDLVLGRIKIYIGIDYDKLIEFSNELGVKASWSSSKELHKYLDNSKYNPKEIFSFKNKGIKIEIDGREAFLGQGFFSKILFDNILPSTMLMKYQNTIKNINFEKDNGEKPS